MSGTDVTKGILIALLIVVFIGLVFLLVYSGILSDISITSDKDALQKENQNLQQQVANLQLINLDLNNRVSSLQEDSQSQNEDKLNLRESIRCRSLENEKDDIRDDIKELEDDIEDLEDEIVDKKARGENTSSLEDRLDLWEERLDDLDDDLDSVNDDLRYENCFNSVLYTYTY